MSLTEQQRTENLYLELDERYEKYFSGKAMWRDLYSIDQEIKPGCIFIEGDEKKPAKHLLTNKDTSDSFDFDDKVLVMQLQTKETAIKAAELLHKIYRGADIRFIPECTQDGICQIRSNIDKSQWEFLNIFCAYRFNREIDHHEQEKLHIESQKRLNNYTQGTSSEGWDSIPGIPVFSTVMGLHGVLRPKERYAPDAKRKQEEFNSHRSRGVPKFFEGLFFRVSMNRYGHIHDHYPYNSGVDPNIDAFNKALGGKTTPQILLEAAGGDFIAPDKPPSRRTLAACGFLGTLAGAVGYVFHVPVVELLGISTPFISLAAVSTVGGIDFAKKRSEYLHRLNELGVAHLGRVKMIEVHPDMLLEPDKVNKEINPKIIEAHTRQGGGIEQVPLTEADTEHTHNALIARILRGGNSLPDAKTEGAVKGITVKHFVR